MIKAILSLVATLIMFTDVPVYSCPTDSIPEVSAGFKSMVTDEPTFNIIYRSQLDIPRESLSFYTDKSVTEDKKFSNEFTLKSGEKKILGCVKLSQGQRITVGLGSYSEIMPNDPQVYIMKPSLLYKDIIAKEDGYYFIEYTAPKLDVKKYSLSTYTIIYNKQ